MTETQQHFLQRLFDAAELMIKGQRDFAIKLNERLQLLDHAYGVSQQLAAQGFSVLSIRIGTHAVITVKDTQHTRQLNGAVKGRSHDGARPFIEFAAVVDGVGVEWKKPMTLKLLGIKQRKH